MKPNRPILAAAVLLLAILSLGAGAAESAAPGEHPGASHFLRAAYQPGSVLATNDFLKGDNLSGEPIDTFQSLRLEFGWQTDGSKDWHHVYNFPSFGIGLYGADYDNDQELGNPTSLYGFFNWPFVRSGRWKLSWKIAFGLTNDWQSYDPVNNPKNTAMGLGRSVHIEPGVLAEYRLARRWALIGGLTATHFSNGGTQRPNHGLNQAGPILYVQWDTGEPVKTPARRHGIGHEKTWDWTITTSYGRRNLDLPIDDPQIREIYGNKSYLVANTTLGAGYRISYKSRVAMGLDVCFDETVGDLVLIDEINRGVQPPRGADHEDKFELGVFGGYEIYAHRTHLILHLGYRLFTEQVPGRLPRLYQRLGIRQFVTEQVFLGLNVRFHEIGSADNLEWVVGVRL